jgi:osmoprotectant transport system ATP-binding protein
MIELANVTKKYTQAAAVRDFSLTVEPAAFCVLLGPSGCGKSTVLRMINGMITPDQGSVKVRGESVASADLEKLRRSIGYVIQSVGLFPHWTIAQNILAVPKLLRWSAAKCAARLDYIIALLEIDATLLSRKPRELSGGQQQRIGVARALAADPDIILMDEPFAALDPLSRANLQAEMQKIQKQSGKTIIFVTHDIDEAFKLASQIVLMNQGQIVQAGEPGEILENPANDFVSQFLGGAFAKLRLLDRLLVGLRMRPGLSDAKINVGESESLKTALNLMLVHGVARLAVVDDHQQRLGEITIEDIISNAV